MNSFDLIRVLCNTSPKAYALITGATAVSYTHLDVYKRQH